MDMTSIIKAMDLEVYSTLPPPVPGPVVVIEGGFVDPDSLVSFSSAINEQQRKAMLNSTLHFQLAANKKYSRFTDPSDLYAFYRKVASQAGGWITQFKVSNRLKNTFPFRMSLRSLTS